VTQVGRKGLCCSRWWPLRGGHVQGEWGEDERGDIETRLLLLLLLLLVLLLLLLLLLLLGLTLTSV